MIHYRQYRPAFFEGFTNEEGEVASVPELLALSFVQNFTERSDFHQFSISWDNDFPTNNNLMAEYKEGHEWWVVAKVWDDDMELYDLPKWESKYKT